MKYRIHFYFSCLVLLGILMSSCSSDDKEATPEIIISDEAVVFAKGAAYKSVDISSNVNFTVSSSQSWCTVTPQSGNSESRVIKISVEANTSNDQRNAVVTIAAGSYSRQISVAQALSDALILKQTQFNVAAAGGVLTVEYQTTGEAEITIGESWITKSEAKTLSEKTVTFNISANSAMSSRSGTIGFKLGSITETATVVQAGMDISIPADQTGVESDAMTLSRKMKIGWNLGNSLEATGSETAWGNPKTTQAIINVVKDAGFDVVRIPCAWSQYLQDDVNYVIKDEWLARVKEVVDYCVSVNMYAIINIHWDGGWLENNPVYEKQEAINKKQKALWNQIATYFRNYDEHLLFAGTNEVHADYGTPSAENLEVQMSFNQTFVDAVRETGGKNAYRNLIVQSYNTNIDLAFKHLKMPVDKVQNRLMAEVHYYDPWDFCGDDGSSYKYLWGAPYKDMNGVSNWGQEDYLDDTFHKMKSQFYDKGIPVILGEYGAMLRNALPEPQLTTHKESRCYYLKSVTAKALEKGIVPVYWDNGGGGSNSFALIDRSGLKVGQPDALQALMEGAGKR